jgi:fermentation-respiration switch protein FrsA (DUF1100 family)
VLLAHGNAGHVASRADWVHRLQTNHRLSVFIFDYRGYGRSEGDPTVKGVLEDATAARAKLCELAGVQDNDMFLMGESLGGAIVTQLAADSLPRGLILQSTFSSLRAVAEYHYPRLAWLVPRDRLNSLERIKEYPGPLFQSHGDADNTIPYDLGADLFDAAPGPKEFVTILGGSHNNWLTTEYLARMDQFIDRVNRAAVGRAN